MRFYKYLLTNGATPHGHAIWHLPIKPGKPGKWMPYLKGELREYEHGYHVMRATDVIGWLSYGNHWDREVDLWEVGTKGKALHLRDKSVVRQVRLLRRVGRVTPELCVTFAVACAERVLPIFERNHPEDSRPRKAMDAAKAWLANPDSAGVAKAAELAAHEASEAAYRAYAEASYEGTPASYAATPASYAATPASYAANATAYAACAASYAANAAWYAACATNAATPEKAWQNETFFGLLTKWE